MVPSSGGAKVCGARANVRPAAPPFPRSQPTRECGELPRVLMGRNSGRRWILCILNVAEHLWWTDIESCKASTVHRPKFLYLLWNAVFPENYRPGRMPPFAPPPATTDHSELCKRWYFYSRDVRPFVCLSQSGIVSKRTSWFLHGRELEESIYLLIDIRFILRSCTPSEGDKWDWAGYDSCNCV